MSVAVGAKGEAKLPKLPSLFVYAKKARARRRPDARAHARARRHGRPAPRPARVHSRSPGSSVARAAGARRAAG